jgi:hypothetical protein
MKGDILGIPGTQNFANIAVSDDWGRNYLVNLTYMLPWGDIGESGRFMGIPGGIVPLSQPFVKEPLEQILNYDNFWKEEIVKEEELAGKTPIEKTKTEAKARLGHAFQTLAPTPAIDLLKTMDAVREKPDYRGRKRPTGVVLADVLAGVKMYPVDYAEQMQRKINKIHPSRGQLARKITGQIRTLYTKKKASKSKNLKQIYQKQIDDKIKQLEGLGKETQKLGKAYEAIK